jgi:hypothetical protein
MTFPDGEGHPAFKFIGQTKGNIWGRYVPKQEDWNKEELEAHQQKLAADRAARKLQEKATYANSLSRVDRDREIRKIAEFVGLRDRHREDLHRRGLNDEEIQEGLYFSVGNGTGLPLKTSLKLAGVIYDYRDDRPVLKGARGYACVAFDADGLAIGWQIRDENPDSNNKYTWAKSAYSSKLTNGELPIAFVKKAKDRPTPTDSIWLAEGILKPRIAALRHQIDCLGASGGNFSNSPEQVQEVLKKTGAKHLIIAPDGGDILNRQVMRRWRREIGWLESLGVPVSIAWWEQYEKGTAIDEIESLDRIQYLTPEEFFTLAKDKKTKIKEWKRECHKLWLESKQFTAITTVKQKYIDLTAPSSGTIFALKSPMGSGKTTLLKCLCESVWKDKGIIYLGYRNTLLLNFCGTSEFYHFLQHNNAHLLKNDPQGKLALCVDSLWRFQPEDFDGKILILDEVCSVIRHLLFSKTIDDLAKVLDRFTVALERCESVICLDGMLSDWAVDYLGKLAPQKKLVTVDNCYETKKPTIHFLKGAIKPDGKIVRNDRSPWLEELFSVSLAAVATDSQVFAESLDNLLTKEGRQVLRIDSKTVPSEEVKIFLRDCNKYLENHPNLFVIYTPSAESGVDIAIEDYFEAHFCFFFGVLKVDSIVQMLGRIRDPNLPRYMWCQERVTDDFASVARSPIARVIDKSINETLSVDLVAAMRGSSREEEVLALVKSFFNSRRKIHEETAYKLQAIANYESRNLRGCLLERLRDLGYEVIEEESEANEEIRKEAATESEGVKLSNANDVLRAETLSVEEQQKGLAFDATWEERARRIKTGFLARLPGIEDKAIWSIDLIYKLMYSSLLKELETNWLFHHPEAAFLFQQQYYQKIYQNQFVAPWKVRATAARIETLRNIGLDEILTQKERKWTAEDAEIQAIYQKCQEYEVRRNLGISAGKSAIRCIGSLLKMLGYEWQCQRIKVEGVPMRFYQLSIDSDSEVLLESIERRFQKLTQKEIDWEGVIEAEELPIVDRSLLTPPNPHPIAHSSVTGRDDLLIKYPFLSPIIQKLERAETADAYYGVAMEISERELELVWGALNARKKRHLVELCRETPPMCEESRKDIIDWFDFALIEGQETMKIIVNTIKNGLAHFRCQIWALMSPEARQGAKSL